MFIIALPSVTGASAYCVDAPNGEGAGSEQMVSANKMTPTRRTQAQVHVAPKAAAPSMGSAGRWPAVALHVSAIYGLTPLRRDHQKLWNKNCSERQRVEVARRKNPGANENRVAHKRNNART